MSSNTAFMAKIVMSIEHELTVYFNKPVSLVLIAEVQGSDDIHVTGNLALPRAAELVEEGLEQVQQAILSEAKPEGPEQ